MWFHFFTGNHNAVGRLTLIDMIEWVETGLQELGHYVTIGNKLAPDAINLIWENSRHGHGKSLQESGVVYGLVCTEVPDGSGFNWRRDGTWAERWEAFPEIAEGAAFIWSAIEAPVSEYSRFCPASYLEFGFSERLVPFEARWEPEHDFGFYGILTPYRRAVLEKLSRNCGVRVSSRILSHHEMLRFIAQCRIGVCLKQSLEWPVPSFTRFGRLLHFRRGIAAEHTPIQTRQSALVPAARPNDDFAEFCLERLNGQWQRDADEAFERYRALMPMRQIMEQLLDETILANTKVRRATAAIPNASRIEAGATRNKEEERLELVAEEGDYNIIRIGGHYLAVARVLGPVHLLGPIDLAYQHITDRQLGDLILVAKTREDLEQKIWETTEQPKLLSEGAVYNIVQFGKRYIAVARALGTVDLVRERVGQRQLGEIILVAHTLADLEQQIAARWSGAAQ